jgi:adenine-specific DNA-methyltransferase
MRPSSGRGRDVVVWFLDTDYDGKVFHICQAFFPGSGGLSWRALSSRRRREVSNMGDDMRGNLPFHPSKHGRIAVKVIDFQGSGVMRKRIRALRENTLDLPLLRRKLDQNAPS